MELIFKVKRNIDLWSGSREVCSEERVKEKDKDLEDNCLLPVKVKRRDNNFGSIKGLEMEKYTVDSLKEFRKKVIWLRDFRRESWKITKEIKLPICKVTS